jgi:hypothetical protein
MIHGLPLQLDSLFLQVPQTRRLYVTNTGSRPVLVSFIPKLDEEAYCKPWIEAKPSSAVVQPRKSVISQ